MKKSKQDLHYPSMNLQRNLSFVCFAFRSCKWGIQYVVSWYKYFMRFLLVLCFVESHAKQKAFLPLLQYVVYLKWMRLVYTPGTDGRSITRGCQVLHIIYFFVLVQKLSNIINRYDFYWPRKLCLVTFMSYFIPCKTFIEAVKNRRFFFNCRQDKAITCYLFLDICKNHNLLVGVA